MKKYIILSFVVGFLTCVGCVYGFGAYTNYRIHKMQDEQNKQAQEIMRQSVKPIPPLGTGFTAPSNSTIETGKQNGR